MHEKHPPDSFQRPNEPTDVVMQMHTTRFAGNIIPHTWYQHITFANGKPDLNAIVILAEICYWYRPREVKDETTGQLLRYEKRFKADKLQRSYQSFAEQFGISKRQARDAVHRLADAGIITLEFRNVKTKATVLANVLFLEPCPKTIRELSTNYPHEGTRATTGQRDTCHIETGHPPRSNVTPPTSECETYTEITTEITTESKQAISPESSSSSGVKSPCLPAQKTLSKGKNTHESPAHELWAKVCDILAAQIPFVESNPKRSTQDLGLPQETEERRKAIVAKVNAMIDVFGVPDVFETVEGRARELVKEGKKPPRTFEYFLYTLKDMCDRARVEIKSAPTHHTSTRQDELHPAFREAT